MPRLVSREPATGALLWQGETDDVDAAVARAAASWPHWAAQASSYRIEAMRRFANVVRRQESELTELIARETGRPLWDCRTETTTVIESIDHAVNAHSQRTGQKRLEGAMGARHALRHKPHGVMAVITSHSLPAQTPCGHIIPALIAGNSVVFKPSEHVPAVAGLLVTLLHEAGVPADAICLVNGDAEIGRSLALHDSVGAIAATASIQTGIALSRALSTRPDKLLALETGGNNPIVLWDTPDIASAVALIIQSAFLSTGQRSTSARRLIVKESLADIVIEELRRYAGRLIVDRPHADPVPFMGPVIDMHMADGLTESFLYLMSNGGKPITHMRRPYEGLPFVTPGIIDVTSMEQRQDVELFGPILQVIRVPDFDAALAEANSSRFGLSASLIGGSPDHYDRFWANVRAGIINWNRPTNHPLPGWPVGGVGLSGNHRPGGLYAADNCAYPVTSAEMEQPRATLGIGLKVEEIAADR
jgi:succinylglutamic semialdehyde dehydrogenase